MIPLSKRREPKTSISKTEAFDALEKLYAGAKGRSMHDPYGILYQFIVEQAGVQEVDIDLRDGEAWKDAVIEACVINHIGWHEDDPMMTLSELVGWEVQIALDPTISSEAQALIEQGKKEGLKTVREWKERTERLIRVIDFLSINIEDRNKVEVPIAITLTPVAS